MTKATLDALDFDGARTIWNRIFDITQDEYSRLYEEAYEKRDGYWNTWLRVRNTAGALGIWGGPAGAVLGLGVGGWNTATGAALARLLRPTIGQDGGITQEDYDLLAGPWAAVIGPVHEDDADPVRATLAEMLPDSVDVDTLIRDLALRGVSFSVA